MFQVLSQSVSRALELTGGNEAFGTVVFTDMMDTFFDILNVGNFTFGRQKRKKYSHPIRSADDFRLSVSLMYNLILNSSVLCSGWKICSCPT